MNSGQKDLNSQQLNIKDGLATNTGNHYEITTHYKKIHRSSHNKIMDYIR